jgi:hypothetical protein
MFRKSLIILSLVIFCLVINFSCSDDSFDQSSTKIESKPLPLPSNQKSGNLGTRTCGGFLSDNFNTLNSSKIWNYYLINVTNVANNGTVSVACTPKDNPNRFTIYDANGNLVQSTQWIGYATFPGPWGQSLSTPQATVTISFPKTTSYYKLVVETVTGSVITDNWEVSIGCTLTCSPPNCPPVCLASCGDCGQTKAGDHLLPNQYQFTDKYITLCGIAVGQQGKITCYPIEVPNRFTLYDSNNNLIATSNWIGYSTTPGPWGQSLNTTAPYVMTFTRTVNMSDTFRMKIETSTSNITDRWEFSTNCCVP